MLAVQHTAKNIPTKKKTNIQKKNLRLPRSLLSREYSLVVTLEKARVYSVISAISVFSTLVIHIVALLVGRRASRTPQEFALIVVSTTSTLIAKSASHVTSLSVDFEHITGTIFAMAGTKFRQIALVLGWSTLSTGVLWFAGIEIATLAGSATRVCVKHTRGRVATGIVAIIFETAVALFAEFDETVAADWTVEELFGLVSKAVVHTVLESASKVFQRTGGPVNWPSGTARGSHNTPIENR